MVLRAGGECMYYEIPMMMDDDARVFLLAKMEEQVYRHVLVWCLLNSCFAWNMSQACLESYHDVYNTGLRHHEHMLAQLVK
jgi:hypothetical protein